MILTTEKFGAALRSRSLKATPKRIAVHEAMLELVHGSAEDVTRYVNDKMGMEISSVSVYGTLALLSDIGVYGRRLSADSRMYFDVDPAPHIHLYDTVNSEYRNISDDKVLSLVENHFKGRRFRGFSVDGVDIKILCHPTQRGRKKTNRK
ncbi:MAG: transcriptional repressor [Bacteroidales bacterium]|nr:transcriptional repressor [Bacteroidales bacterium]